MFLPLFESVIFREPFIVEAEVKTAEVFVTPLHENQQSQSKVSPVVTPVTSEPMSFHVCVPSVVAHGGEPAPVHEFPIWLFQIGVLIPLVPLFVPC